MGAQEVGGMRHILFGKRGVLRSPARGGGGNKYGARKTPFKAHFGERTYDSRAEAAYAARLELLRKAGEVLWWLPQVPIPLPGGVVYRADFMVCELGHMNINTEKGLRHYPKLRFIDVKGKDTPVSRLKRKQVAEIHGIEVEVVG